MTEAAPYRLHRAPFGQALLPAFLTAGRRLDTTAHAAMGLVIHVNALGRGGFFELLPVGPERIWMHVWGLLYYRLITSLGGVLALPKAVSRGDFLPPC